MFATILILLLLFGPASFCAWLAKINNRSPYRWFVLYFIFGCIPAVIIVTSLPPGKYDERAKRKTQSLPYVATQEEDTFIFECGECGYVVDENDKECSNCGANIEEIEDADEVEE